MIVDSEQNEFCSLGSLRHLAVNHMTVNAWCQFSSNAMIKGFLLVDVRMESVRSHLIADMRKQDLRLLFRPPQDRGIQP